MMVDKEQKTYDIILSDKEHKLIELLRRVTFGRIVIFMENGKPVRIEEIKESFKL